MRTLNGVRLDLLPASLEEPAASAANDPKVLLQEGHLVVDQDRLLQFCRRWKLTRLSIFGSALRNDFRPDSDLDFFVDFEPEAEWGLGDIGDMQEELENWFGRAVDIVETCSLVNPIRRKRILETRRLLFES